MGNKHDIYLGFYENNLQINLYVKSPDLIT